MGLNIYFFNSTKTAEVGYFRKIWGLFYWINQHVERIESSEAIRIEKKHLEALSMMLDEYLHVQQLPCKKVGYEDTKEFKFWFEQSAQEVKNWIEKMLKTFDFQNDQLFFLASW